MPHRKGAKTPSEGSARSAAATGVAVAWAVGGAQWAVWLFRYGPLESWRVASAIAAIFAAENFFSARVKFFIAIRGRFAIVTPMMSTTTATMSRTDERRFSGKPLSHTDANRGKLAVVERVLRNQLSAVLTAGFHGLAMIELDINDGTIQAVRHRVEQMER